MILEELGNEGQTIRKAYQRKLPSDSTKDYYFIHRNTGVTEPVIIEYGFVDTAADANRIKNNWENYAEAVVRAVAEYKGITYNESSTSNTYTVQKGDTLWSIAKTFNTTVKELKELNNLSGNILYVGQTLTVPSYYTAEDTNISYIVKKGDTLYSISVEYGISVNDLKEYNNLTSNLLSIGQIIEIPSSTTIVTPTEDDIINEETSYIVQSGDTLWSISQQYGVTVDDIKTTNNLTNDLLTIGMTLSIPTSSDIIIYTVQKGDSLWALAQEYNTTVDDIKQLNNLTSDVLSINQELQIKKDTK